MGGGGEGGPKGVTGGHWVTWGAMGGVLWVSLGGPWGGLWVSWGVPWVS